MRNKVLLFVAAMILGGVGGAAGSILGGAFGERALFIGGCMGGVLIAPATAALALWLGWIQRDAYWATTLGAAAGFCVAAAIAMHTLSSPVGPVLSTLLVGAGAVLGSTRSA
jgi:hypothetical protein